jgi:AAA+ superfamily predicted ATPase
MAKKKKQQIEPPIPLGQFRAKIHISSNPQSRPRPLFAYMTIYDMKEKGLRAGDFVRVDQALGIAWARKSLDNGNVLVSSAMAQNGKFNDGSFVMIDKIPVLPINAAKVRIICDHELTTDLRIYLSEVLYELEYTFCTQVFEAFDRGKSTTYQLIVPEYDNGIFRITRNTRILFDRGYSSALSQNVGGLSTEMDVIRRTINMSLYHPEKFEKYSLKPPRGILLCGPPGTGKTLIAKSIAHETKAHFIPVNAPEIISKYYGEAEEKLKDMFDNAIENDPSIIFIDEIDSICPRRGNESSELERRIVGTLVSLMDNLADQNARVFVIGATNLPNVIDESLRRRGRFDRELEIGIPDFEKRKNILTVLLANTPNSLTELNIEELSSMAHGYVGADLAAACNEAGLICIERTKSSINTEATDNMISSNAGFQF